MHKLLPPLELLICGEESTVRSVVSWSTRSSVCASFSLDRRSWCPVLQSARSVEAVVDSMSDEGLCAHFYPFLSKLANKDW